MNKIQRQKEQEELLAPFFNWALKKEGRKEQTEFNCTCPTCLEQPIKERFESLQKCWCGDCGERKFDEKTKHDDDLFWERLGI